MRVTTKSTRQWAVWREPSPSVELTPWSGPGNAAPAPQEGFSCVFSRSSSCCSLRWPATWKGCQTALAAAAEVLAEAAAPVTVVADTTCPGRSRRLAGSSEGPRRRGRDLLDRVRLRGRPRLLPEDVHRVDARRRLLLRVDELPERHVLPVRHRRRIPPLRHDRRWRWWWRRRWRWRWRWRWWRWWRRRRSVRLPPLPEQQRLHAGRLRELQHDDPPLPVDHLISVPPPPGGATRTEAPPPDPTATPESPASCRTRSR